MNAVSERKKAEKEVDACILHKEGTWQLVQVATHVYSLIPTVYSLQFNSTIPQFHNCNIACSFLCPPFQSLSTKDCQMLIYRRQFVLMKTDQQPRGRVCLCTTVWCVWVCGVCGVWCVWCVVCVYIFVCVWCGCVGMGGCAVLSNIVNIFIYVLMFSSVSVHI